MTENKPGKLYVVATPIGNLGDFSPRAIETLETVDFIAAEDTRVGAKLLNKFEIKKPQVSYFEHNRKTKGDYILSRILAGESCAIITDAGTPAISDPGVDLVDLCAQNGVEVVAVPGCSAVVAALSISGMACGRFTFEGFLPVPKKERRAHLEEVKNERRTMVFYEAPHKLKGTLEDLLKALGDRRIALVREITKIHEEVIRTTLSEACARYEREDPRGEFVIVVEGAAPAEKTAATPDEAAALAKAYMTEGMSPSEAAKIAAAECGLKKGDVYRLITR